MASLRDPDSASGQFSLGIRIRDYLLPTLLVVVLLGLPGLAQATTTTWTGNSDTLWNNSSNWDSGVPDSTKDAVIPGSRPRYPDTFPAATELDCNSLTIQNGGAVTFNASSLAILHIYNGITVSAGGYYYQTDFMLIYWDGGNLVNNGSFKSDATATDALSFTSGSVNITGSGTTIIYNARIAGANVVLGGANNQGMTVWTNIWFASGSFNVSAPSVNVSFSGSLDSKIYGVGDSVTFGKLQLSKSTDTNKLIIQRNFTANTITIDKGQFYFDGAARSPAPVRSVWVVLQLLIPPCVWRRATG